MSVMGFALGAATGTGYLYGPWDRKPDPARNAPLPTRRILVGAEHEVNYYSDGMVICFDPRRIAAGSHFSHHPPRRRSARAARKATLTLAEHLGITIVP